MLHDSGVSMGNEFNPADENNPSGYFEDRKLVHVIKAGGLADYIKERNEKEEDWGMKHPELCGKLAENEHLFDDLRVIHLQRPFTDVVMSLDQMFEMPLEEAKEKKYRKENDLEELTASILDVKFYDLVDNPKKEYSKVCDFLDIEPNFHVLERVDNDNVHHRDTIRTHGNN